MFLFGLLKVFLAFMSSPLGLWSPQTTRFASFFLFYLSFLNQWCCCFVQLINICWASLQHLAVPFYNFPLHLHTCFLIYTDDKILPYKSVLKRCLILVAWNSDFFGSVYNGYYFLCLLSFKYFSTHKKNVNEPTTVYGVSVFSEMILWTKETFSFYSNALHLESNLKHRVFHVDVRFENWGISLEVYSCISPSFS